MEADIEAVDRGAEGEREHLERILFAMDEALASRDVKEVLAFMQ